MIFMKKVIWSLIFVLLISLVGCTSPDIKPEQEIKKSVNLYYPNIDDEKYYYKTVELNIMEEKDVIPAIVDAYKENVLSGTEVVMTENADINDVEITSDGVLKIDFNSSFVDDMNAGSSYEEMIIHSIANTFGEYYEADKVEINVEKNPYKSGHIEFEEGEYLTPDYTNTVCVNNVC